MASYNGFEALIYSFFYSKSTSDFCRSFGAGVYNTLHFKEMSTLKEVWQQLNMETVDKENFSKFLNMLSIQLNNDEVTKIFTMLDINNRGYLSYDDIRVFFTMTKVYDKSKYPKKKVKRRSSYKIHPE